MEYKSAVSILGLPLVHVSLGRLEEGSYRRGIAKGWIAIGDISFGVIFAAGGIAVGGFGVGGLAAGILSLGGLAVGLASIGGLAFGALAVGGAAFGVSAAFGGVAIAGEFASGGVAIAPHVNDAAAGEYLAAHPFFRIASRLMDYAVLLVFIPAVAALVARVRKRDG